MAILFFPDHDSLRLALASGVLPSAVTRAPAIAGFDPQGHLWLEPEAPLHRDAIHALSRFGIRVMGSSAATQTEAVSCWHQLLPLQTCLVNEPRGPVLFELRPEQLAPFAAEIRRLTGRSIAYRWIEEANQPLRVLMMVTNPPYFTLSRSFDRGNNPGPRVFIEQAPRIWVPLGWTHPLADQIDLADGRILLIRPPFDWILLNDEPFREEWDQFPCQERPIHFRDRSFPQPIPIYPKLVRSDQPSIPELWVLPKSSIPFLEQLIAQLDERVLGRLMFAIVEQPSPTVLLRMKPGKGPPPMIELDVRGYAPYLKLPYLFLPVGRCLQPALRRDSIRKLLSTDGKSLVWLQPDESGSYRIQSVPESAFQSLIDCYEHRVDEPARPLTPWKPQDRFTMEPFVQRPDVSLAPLSESLHRVQSVPMLAGRESPSRSGIIERLRSMIRGLFEKSPAPEPPPPPRRPKGESPPLDVDRTLKEVLRRPEDKKVVSDDRPGESEQRRQAIESRILEKLGRIEPQARAVDWQELAGLYRRANNHADAALCALNAIWDLPHPSPHDAYGWLLSESKGVRGVELDLHRREAMVVPIERWLNASPTPGHARAIAAFVVWGALETPMSPSLVEHLDAIHQYLDDHEDWLPVRAVWLVRSTLARCRQGDVLALARSRDRLIERLQDSGLGLDLDVPSFLRFASHGVSERFQKVRDWLKRLRDPIKRWLIEQATGRAAQRTPSRFDSATTRGSSRLSEFGLDPELQYTPAYVDLILAWGLSRLGEHNSGRDLVQHATRVLSNGDVVHEVLLEGYRYRIQQVQEGRAPRGPLPSELLQRIAGLRPLGEGRYHPRYPIDKLRQHSRILEPAERMDAYRNPSRYAGVSADLREALAGLRDLPDPRELAEQASRLLDQALKSTDAATLPAVVLAILDVASRVGEAVLIRALREVSRAVESLEGTMPAQVRLLEQAIFIAVQLGQTGVLRDLLARFSVILDGQRGLQALRGIEPLTGESFRGLRRLGLRDDCEQLLQRMQTWVLGGLDLRGLREKQPREWPTALRTLLHIGAGWFFCGQDDRAKAILDEARDQLLYSGELPASEQTALALTYAATLGHADPRIALGRLEELFQRLRNIQLNSSTNSHYMLKPLELIETVVRSVVNDSFTLGPAVRRWLDDDEFLIRQRIDRDLREMMQIQHVTE